MLGAVLAGLGAFALMPNPRRKRCRRRNPAALLAPATLADEAYFYIVNTFSSYQLLQKAKASGKSADYRDAVNDARRDWLRNFPEDAKARGWWNVPVSVFMDELRAITMDQLDNPRRRRRNAPRYAVDQHAPTVRMIRRYAADPHAATRRMTKKPNPAGRRITKKAWYNDGGFANSDLYRLRRSGKWQYYRVARNPRTRYRFTVPPTNDVGSYAGTCRDRADALSDYNSARAHDGFAPLTRMPAGTVYTRIRVARNPVDWSNKVRKTADYFLRAAKWEHGRKLRRGSAKYRDARARARRLGLRHAHTMGVTLPARMRNP